MVVLSLFDGMSCGQIALKELGVKVSKYYASEVDKFAIANTMANFPHTIQLGDVRNIDARQLGRVDMLIGGSPCQSFSFAGKRAGMATSEREEIYTLEKYLRLKEAGFDFEGQSYLFWEYMRILHELREVNPDIYFLLENVEMGKKWEAVLTEAIGIPGVHIDSALVSAQMRKRIYWTNIRVKQVGLFDELVPDIPQPKDRGILLRDIMEKDVPERYYLNESTVAALLEYNERNKANGNGFNATFHRGGGKMHALTVGGKGCKDLVVEEVAMDELDYICVAQRGGRFEGDAQHLEARKDGKTNALTTVQKDNYILQRPRGNNNGGRFSEKSPTLTSNSWEHNNIVVEREVRQLNPSRESGGTQPYQQNRVYDSNGLAPALMNGHGGQTINVTEGERIRKLTPSECAHLQTIPDWYKWAVSETQQYKMLGNGWTVEVIKHIFSFLPQAE